MPVTTSETSIFRNLFLDYCKGDGIDLGYGGDPVVPWAITLDLENPYAETGKHPQNLSGDARNLYWFKDNVFSFCYSSHLLEDMDNTEEVLIEWIRIIKYNGYLLLLLPEQQEYLKCCKINGSVPNPNHKKEDFGIKYIKEILEKLNVIIIKEYTFEELSVQTGKPEYNFAIIARKERKE
jgi:predicted SAM-dependent methyltransferase